MNFKKILMAIVTGLVIFASCVKLDNTFNNRIPINSKGEYAIVLSQSNQTTKAVATSTSQWHYDDFSLYTWNSNNEVIMNPFTVIATGTDSYDYDGVGTQTLQYFKNSADSYSFIGVIPTTDATLNNGSVTVGVESFVVDDNRVSGTLTADSPKEFLWARADVAKSKYGQTVTLPFKHGNALLYLGFISDDANTQIIDYTPTIPEVPASQGTPDTETYTKKDVKFIDELVAGNEVQVAIGAIGKNSTKLTTGNPNPLYIGTNNSTWKSKDWLLSIKDAVNAQFVYYRLNAVYNSTSKIEVTEDWDSKDSNKNIYMMKLADGVDKDEFAAGNDVFWNALVAHESDWVGGSPAVSLKSIFEQAYADGWRVIRINTNVAYKKFSEDMTVESTNPNEVYVWLASNVKKSTQVCTITPGTPATTGSPEIPGLKGIRVFSAKADVTDGYAHLAHTKTADATVATGLTFDNRVAVTDSIQFSLPTNTIIPVGTTENDAVYSPTTFYSIPGDSGLTHFVVKLSYIYKGTTVYDVRVPITLPAAGLEQGKYYKYIIKITSIGNGTNDPDEANDEKDDIDIVDNPIHVNVTVTDYEEGHTEIVEI